MENPEFAYSATVLHGRAASGKTILLKRVAWELARSGALVLWLRTAFIGDGFLPVRSLFEAVSKSKGLRGKKVVVIMDDPFKSTGLQPKDLLSAAQAAGVHIVLITSYRTSDWGPSEVDGLSGYFSIVEVEELSDELDAEEWCRLPAYLVSLGICPNEQDAAARIQGVPTRLAQDTLSMLYYLLPQTKPMIASSVKDEFFRLGDRAWLTNVLVGEAACSTAPLEIGLRDGRGRMPLPNTASHRSSGLRFGSRLRQVARHCPPRRTRLGHTLSRRFRGGRNDLLPDQERRGYSDSRGSH